MEQQEKEAPGKFLDRLREALRRFTEIDPESEEGKVILKDRFLTQSAPDIHRKLLKQAYGPNQCLDTLLQLAQSIMVGNMRKRKKGKKRQRKRRNPTPWLWKTFLNSLRKMPRGAQVKRDGLAITVERRGTSSGIALRHLSRPWLHVCKGLHWKRDCPQRRRSPESDSQDNQDWRCPGVPTQAPILITPEESRVLIIVGGQSVDFLLDTGATYSVLTQAPGPLSSRSASIMVLSGWAKRYYFSYSLSCNWDSVLFSHEFLIVPESPSPLLGRDILSKVHASVFMNMEPALFNGTNFKY